MNSILLLIEQETQQSTLLLWTLGAVLIAASVASIFWQRKTGRELQAELKELEKLKKRNVESELVLKAMKLATWQIDPKTMTVNFHNDFREIEGKWKPEIENDDVNRSRLLLHEEDIQRVTKALADICQGRSQEYHEIYRVMIPHTQRFYWEEGYATVAELDAEGMPAKIVGTTMIIDDRKNMEEALVEARKKAEESDRLKSAFIANMSHEIRTPLNAIIGFTSVLPDVEGAEERKELINLIQENNQKLLRIVDDVLSISKIEAGNDQLIMTTFELNGMLAELTDQFTPKLNPGVTIQTAFERDSLYITTDMNRLQESMKHLLSNAVKFTDAGQIDIGYEAAGDDKIRLWVKDTGKGISEEDQQRVFERFFKVDEFIPGAGLGLSTCQTLAQSMGGDVTVESKLGEGSVFSIIIPAKTE